MDGSTTSNFPNRGISEGTLDRRAEGARGNQWVCSQQDEDLDDHTQIVKVFAIFGKEAHPECTMVE